ncbi:MAG: hypothetical protein JOY84_20310 [Curvibacter sp.]|nr:hypothetical protein [Curvibacter sp.]
MPLTLSSELRQRLLDLATQLRIGLSVEATVALPKLMTDIVEHRRNAGTDELNKLAGLMSECQEQWRRQDWIGLADTLEYDIGNPV